MRCRKVKDGVTVNAVAGNHVVMLGFDLSPSRRRDCLGFAIQREDKTEGERYWMKGMKTFEETDPGLGPGGQVSSRDHPFQSFQWSDYSAKPSHEYEYTVVPLYGKQPSKLREGPAVTVKVETEPELGKPHSVFFNRGSVATQEYARVFQDKAPGKLTGTERDAALRWLSRGLEEAFVAFVERAKGEGWGLRGAFYEFEWPRALEALHAAKGRKADVRILYDGIENAKRAPLDDNLQAIGDAGIGAFCKPRTTGKIMHNKFLVLTRKGKPQAVWTGSTNLSENGIFGHLNCGHIVEDTTLAADFLTYWEELCTNPEVADERLWMGEHNARPLPPGEELPAMTTVFSPHRGEGVLKWYREIAGLAEGALMMTFAFGMSAGFKDLYRRDDDILRFALMDKVAVGKKESVEKQKREIQEIRNRPNVVIAIGNRILTNSFDRWLRELDKLSPKTRVPWVHTKFMLVDPLGKSPTTITGSANWSDDSTSTNNENMVIIHGDQRVADIYLGEFMRLHSHYAFRESLTWHDDDDPPPQYLQPTKSWQDDYFDPAKDRYRRRLYFSGSSS